MWASLVRIFGEISGLMINHGKLAFVFVHMSVDQTLATLRCLNTSVTQLPLTYLGLPLKEKCLTFGDWTPCCNA
jgi:hypothetical protein